MFNKSIRILVVIGALILIGKSFLIFSDDVFGYHDSTQAGRIYDFSLNLKHLQIPPRIAPSFSYGMGYPIFNHYAPTAYWITSALHMFGLSIPLALKISFFTAVVVAGLGMYLFSRRYFSCAAACVIGLLYGLSPLMGLEVFVRGNLAELWFLALFPLTLYAADQAAEKKNYSWVVLLGITFSLLLTAHNALSLVGGATICIYAALHKSRRVLIGLAAGTGMSAYFLIPAVLELSQTHATAVASLTAYADHFVCLRQLWDSPIGFGGSMKGCIDGMSFQIGKPLLIAGGVGLLLYVHSLLKRAKSLENRLVHLFVAAVLCGSLFLALDISAPAWDIAEPVLKLFQFPWRFLGFVVFGLAFFSGFFIDTLIKTKYGEGLTLLVCVVVIFLSIPFFKPNPDKLWSSQDFTRMFLSEEYLRNEIAYRVPEYLPKSASFEAWMKIKDDIFKPSPHLILPQDGELFTIVQQSPFGFEVATSSKDFAVSKHYSPHLDMNLNGASVTPTEFDELGRPRITTQSDKSILTVNYLQTPLEQVSNLISILAAGLLLLPYIKTWKRNS
jgi:hypothetical protein